MKTGRKISQPAPQIDSVPQMPQQGQMADAASVPQQMPMEPQPPMDMNAPEPMGEEPQGNVPPQTDGQQGGDEKEIQSLAGKLSQKLRDHNQNNPDDGQLSKYVMGMLGSACEGLDDSQKEEIKSKIDGMGDEEGSEPQEQQPEEMPMESRKYFHNIIKETLTDLDRKGSDDEIRRPKCIKRTPANSPFMAPIKGRSGKLNERN